jgi:hypothetical protein
VEGGSLEADKSCVMRLVLQLHLVGLPLLGLPLCFFKPSADIYDLLRRAHILDEGRGRTSMGTCRRRWWWCGELVAIGRVVVWAACRRRWGGGEGHPLPLVGWCTRGREREMREESCGG